MGVLWRTLSVAALVVSAVILVLSILSVRKEQRVRPGLDLVRLGIALATTVLMARLLGITTSEGLLGLGLLVGLLLGVYEGLHLRVRFLGKRTFARRSAVGVAAWGAGVVLVQGAGVIGRLGLADFGLALSFFGIGQLAGLLTGRWQTVLRARQAAAGTAAALLVLLALAGALLPGLSGPAAAADAVDIRAVLGGQVPGVTVTVRGNGSFMGEALSLVFANATAAEVAVAVPVGLQFVPEDPAVQTMIAAGGETIAVPPTQGGDGFRTVIQAFCGEYPDEIPSVGDTFQAGEVVTGEAAAVVAVIHQGGVYGRDQQEAVWHVTDAYDISGNPGATALVEQAAGGEEGPAAILAIDGDPGNSLHQCAANRAPFGDTRLDADRCFSFRYAVPADGIDSAVVYLSIAAPTGSLQDTDSVGVAVGVPFPEQCGLAGGMAGCVTVHGGFQGGEVSLTVNLLDLACDPAFQGGQEVQDAVRAQLATGVLHMVLQDDTAVLGGRLGLNEGAPALPCGTSAEAAPVAAPVPCSCSQLSAGEGARTSLAGLGGAAALLATALAGAGSTVGGAAGGPGGSGRSWRDLLKGGPRPGGGAAAWVDPASALGQGRAAAALDRLPAGGRGQVEQALTARLETEQLDRLAGEVQAAVGPIGVTADPAEVLRSSPKAAEVLGRLPGEVRQRLEGKLLAGWQEQQTAGAADEAWQALRRDRAVGLVRDALARRDGGTVQRALAAVGEPDRDRVWSRAAAGLGLGPGDLEYPPPAPGGEAPAPVELDGYLDAEGGLTEALGGGGETEGVISRLPAGMRAHVEGRLSAKLEAGRVSRWVDKLREAAGPDRAGAVLDNPEVRRLLAMLPPGVRDRVSAAAAGVLDGQTVEGMAAAARRLVARERAVDLLRTAVGLGDGDQADAVMNAVGAALDTAGHADLDRLVQRAAAAGPAALDKLARHGDKLPPVDLTAHLAGEPDLLAAARRAEGVEQLLQSAGSLRPRVEAELVGALEAERVGRAVREAAAGLSPVERAAADVMDALRQLPGVRDKLDRLPLPARQEAYRLLGEQLAAERLGAALEEVGRGLRLDAAEAAVRRAVQAGDLDAADRALAGLSPDEAQEVTAALAD